MKEKIKKWFGWFDVYYAEIFLGIIFAVRDAYFGDWNVALVWLSFAFSWGIFKVVISEESRRYKALVKLSKEIQSNEEDAVQTTAYLANVPGCCSGAEQLDHVLGMLGSDIMDDGIYHSEDQHPKRNDHSDPVLSL